MRIVHVCQWYMPGLSYQENLLPKEQAKLGNEVWILTSNRVPPHHRLLTRKRFTQRLFEEDNVRIWRLPSVGIARRAQVYFRSLQKTLHTIKPDVVHAHGLWMLPTLQVLSSRPPCAVVADDHADNGNLPSGLGAHLRFAIARRTCKRLRRLGGKVISVNPFSRCFVIEILDHPPESVCLLPLGINSEKFYPDPSSRLDTRRILKVSQDEIVFVTSGRLTPGKGFESLLRAFRKVCDRYAFVRLVMIGSGSSEYETSLRRLVQDLYLDEVVTFRKWMAEQELRAYYNAADVGVMPGKLGGMKEILGVGRPLIAPDHVATRYLVDRENGTLFKSDDMSSLAHAMISYVERPELRRVHGNKSLELTRDYLSWESIARSSLKIYIAAELPKN